MIFMLDAGAVTGSIVIPKRGRDKGLPMVVVRSEGDYCWLADGKLRRLEHPKMKKLMHIQPTNAVAYDIKKRLENGQYLNDADIRKAISCFLGRLNDVKE